MKRLRQFLERKGTNSHSQAPLPPPDVWELIAEGRFDEIDDATLQKYVIGIRYRRELVERGINLGNKSDSDATVKNIYYFVEGGTIRNWNEGRESREDYIRELSRQSEEDCAEAKTKSV